VSLVLQVKGFLVPLHHFASAFQGKFVSVSCFLCACLWRFFVGWIAQVFLCFYAFLIAWVLGGAVFPAVPVCLVFQPYFGSGLRVGRFVSVDFGSRSVVVFSTGCAVLPVLSFLECSCCNPSVFVLGYWVRVKGGGWFPLIFLFLGGLLLLLVFWWGSATGLCFGVFGFLKGIVRLFGVRRGVYCFYEFCVASGAPVFSLN